jgi:diaminopimelate decarboxylase
MHFKLPPTIEKEIIDKAQAVPGPFYLYDAGQIRSICRTLKKLPYESTSVHFASMANVHDSFLKIIREEGINIFVNSLQHLELSIKAGFKEDRIIFTASAMDAGVMRAVRGSGALVNLDSLGQVRKFRDLFGNGTFGIRCNIGTLVEARSTRGGYFIGKNSRLGLSLKEIKSLGGSTDITGLHIYVGTDIYDISYFEQCYNSLISLAADFPALKYLDFGGGFGCNAESRDPFDFEAYGIMVKTCMEKANAQVHS